MIIHVVVTDKMVFLLDIYDKSEQDSISEKELAALLKMILANNHLYESKEIDFPYKHQWRCSFAIRNKSQK